MNKIVLTPKEKVVKAKTVGELSRILSTALKSGVLKSDGEWNGWDDGSLILDDQYIIESGAYDREES